MRSLCLKNQKIAEFVFEESENFVSRNYFGCSQSKKGSLIFDSLYKIVQKSEFWDENLVENI